MLLYLRSGVIAEMWWGNIAALLPGEVDENSKTHCDRFDILMAFICCCFVGIEERKPLIKMY